MELIAETAETLCGFKPELDEVALFLKNGPVASHEAQNEPKATTTTMDRAKNGSVHFGYRILGASHECRNARGVLTSVIEDLAERDATFLERFVALPRHGRTRRYIARNQNDLYPGRLDLAQQHSYQLRSGYWLGVNLSRNQIEQVLRLASSVADLAYGTDLVVNLGA